MEGRSDSRRGRSGYSRCRGARLLLICLFRCVRRVRVCEMPPGCASETKRRGQSTANRKRSSQTALPAPPHWPTTPLRCVRCCPAFVGPFAKMTTGAAPLPLCKTMAGGGNAERCYAGKNTRGRRGGRRGVRRGHRRPDLHSYQALHGTRTKPPGMCVSRNGGSLRVSWPAEQAKILVAVSPRREPRAAPADRRRGGARKVS